MFAGKTLREALILALKSNSNASAFHEYVYEKKAHKMRWVRAAQALKAGDMDRLNAYLAPDAESRREEWAKVKAKEAPKPVPVAKPAPAPVKAKAPAKQPKAKPAPAQAKPAIDPALIEAVAQAVLAALTAQAKGKKVA